MYFWVISNHSDLLDWPFQILWGLSSFLLYQFPLPDRNWGALIPGYLSYSASLSSASIWLWEINGEILLPYFSSWLSSLFLFYIHFQLILVPLNHNICQFSLGFPGILCSYYQETVISWIDNSQSFKFEDMWNICCMVIRMDQIKANFP